MPYLHVDTETYRRIEKYADAADIHLAVAVKDALNEWMDTTGALLMEFLSTECTEGTDSRAEVNGAVAIHVKPGLRTTSRAHLTRPLKFPRRYDRET